MNIMVCEVAPSINGGYLLEIVDVDTNEVKQLTPYQLVEGVVLRGAPVSNIKIGVNKIVVDLGGELITIPVKLPDNIKKMIRSKQSKDAIQKKEGNKDKELDTLVQDYRVREEKRKADLKEMSKGFAKPGQLTDEERRARRMARFGIKAKKK